MPLSLGANSSLSFTNTTFYPNIDPFTNFWCISFGFPIRGTSYALFSVGGVASNTFLLLAILPNRRLRNIRHLFLIHLAGIGIVSSVLTVAMSSVSLISCAWVGGRHFCVIYSYFFSILVCLNVWTITGLSWDKYQTIASPLHHSQTSTICRMLLYMLILWAVAGIVAMPPLIGAGRFVFRVDMAMCTVDVIGEGNIHWYPLVYLAVLYFLPFVMMSYCYMHIFRIARSQHSRIAASMIKMGSLIQAPLVLGPTRATSLKGRRAMGTILHIIGAFVLTFLPFAVNQLVEFILRTKANVMVVTVVTALIQAAPMTNAFVYGVRNRILRESFVSFVCKRSSDVVEVRPAHRRDSIMSLQPRPSSTLRLSVLLHKCAAERNFALSPPPRRSLHEKRMSLKASTIEIPEGTSNAEIFAVIEKPRPSLVDGYLQSKYTSNFPPVDEVS